jgi:hypothetical protein
MHYSALKEKTGAPVKIDNRHDVELGKLLAERAGLSPDQISEEWDAASDGKTVSVTLRVPILMPAAEFAALNERAAEAVDG